MKVQRTIPPSAAPLPKKAVLRGLRACFSDVDCSEEVRTGLKEYLGVRDIFLCSSGKAALTLLLRAMKKLRPGRDRVLIPAYTCFSIPSAVKRAGLKVQPCDIDIETLDFDPKQLERAGSNDLLAIVPSNLFGRPADIERIREIAVGCGAFVVDDAAQAFGISDRSGIVGTRGDAGILSFGRGKPVSCGSGGAVLTSDPEIASAVRAEYADIAAPHGAENLRDLLYGAALGLLLRPNLCWLPAGMPWLGIGRTVFSTAFPVKRLSRVSAGLMDGWMKRLSSARKTQLENSKTLAMLFRGAKTAAVQKDLPYLRLPLLTADRRERDSMAEVSRRNGLGAAVMYPQPISSIQEIRGDVGGRSFPNAEQVAERLLTLPTHEYLRDNDIKRLVESLQDGGLKPQFAELPENRL